MRLCGLCFSTLTWGQTVCGVGVRLLAGVWPGMWGEMGQAGHSTSSLHSALASPRALLAGMGRRGPHREVEGTQPRPQLHLPVT